MNDREFLSSLLSPKSDQELEAMAQKAHGITLRNFGRTIQLYTPIYLSNYCENRCLYCGFNAANRINRKKLTREELINEARLIHDSGLRHVLVLTGESRKRSPVSYIKECAGILQDYFDSISIEIYPLEEKEYAELARAGIDGLTLYQEVYDRSVYEKLHPAGPKKDYDFRLAAPERAARAGFRSVNTGCLLGLNDWRSEVLNLGLHAAGLQDQFPDVEIGVSVPRLRPQLSDFSPKCVVSDREFAQIITALRIFLPRASIALSTRENAQLRDNLIGLGITRMSAGS